MRLFKSRRGVSPVIASIMMVVAVIVTGTVVMVWSSGVFASRRSEASVFFSDRGEAMREILVIEDVWFYENGEYVDVTVRNVGAVDLDVVAVYMNDSEAWDEGEWIKVGKAATITLDFDWYEGQYYIVVTTARGNQVRELRSTLG